MNLLFLLIVACIAAVGAIESNSVVGTIRLPQEARASDARVVLNGGQHVGLVTASGAFTIHDVPAGSYQLEVLTTDYVFDTVRVVVSEDQVRASVNKYKLPQPLVLRPRVKANFFQAHPPFNVLGYLKNPMVIMMLVTMFGAFVFPKMMENMDPEERAEMEKMQAKYSMQGIMKSAQNAAKEAQEGNQPKQSQRKVKGRK